LQVALADRSSATAEISFLPEGGRRLGQGAEIAAEAEPPLSGSVALGGDLSVAAHGTASGRSAVVDICLEHVPRFAAGRYQGTIAVYGPKIADFSYALVVTAKWPWWSAVGLIALVIVVSLAVAVVTNFLGLPTDWRAAVGSVIAGGLAIGLGLLTYWTIYAKSDTWGSDPGTELSALAIASFTAATSGLVTARKLIPPKPSSGDDEGRDQTTAEPPNSAEGGGGSPASTSGRASP
jgi:hypothetical protein